jgi:tetratricopeptide (TPR) repeat protein
MTRTCQITCVIIWFLSPSGLAAATQIDTEELMKAGRAALLDRNYVTAYRLYSAALERLKTGGDNDARLAQALFGLGLTCRLDGRCSEAAKHYVRAIRTLESTPQPDRAALVEMWQFLSSAYDCQALLSKARQALERAVELKEELGGKSPGLIELLANLAMVYNKQRMFEAAESTGKRAVAALLKISPIDPSVSVLVRTNLGTIYGSMGRYPEAEVWFREALAIIESSPKAGGEQEISLLNNLATICSSQKKHPDARVLLARAVDLLEHCATMEPRATAQVLKNYAACLRKTGHASEAKKFETKAGALLSVLPRRELGELVVDANALRRL